MATTAVNFTMTAGQLGKITDYLNYQENIIDPDGDGEETIANPQSRKVFLYEYMQGHLKELYKAEKAKDGEVARQTALDEAVTETNTLTIAE